MKFNTASISGKTVLVAPLDWGLGHVTRCIPIIRALLKRKNTVILAATGPRRAIFEAEFPGIPIFDLPDYAVRLSGSWHGISPGLLLRLPALRVVIRKETKWLANLCQKESIDLVISDNRYGLFHKDVHSVFITHQLFVCSGFGERVDRWLMKLHFRFINRFTECWVPDSADPERSLAGRLSHPPQRPPFPVTYLGLLSRFADTEADQAGITRGEDLLILLSGPEPQRSILETRIRSEWTNFPGRILLVRGLPGTGEDNNKPREQVSDRRRIVDHLPTAEMQKAIMEAGSIFCRSGYSTLMDLIALRRTAVLVPTPGQPEQEYLAGYTSAKGWMTTQRQSHVTLAALPDSIWRNSSEKLIAGTDYAGLFFNGTLPALTLR